MNQMHDTLEFNFDGLVGPTHNYAGLAPGNLASQASKARPSSPQNAALQGLAKMRRLHALGVPQAVLPPQPRPDVQLLRRFGFTGDDAAVLVKARDDAPHLLAAACSASSMWTANAATVCPSADAADGRVHFTPANLIAALHRANETAQTAATLRAVFPDPQRFAHHPALPATRDTGDEGAANHTRLCDGFDRPGVQLFVYGDPAAGDGDGDGPKRFNARQARAASVAVARMHGLRPEATVFARQHPDVIDAGVFHNDVIAVGHRELLFCHELAFADRDGTHEALRRAAGDRLRIVEVSQTQVALPDAVSTYLFNSQIVTTGDGRTVLIAPAQCRRHAGVAGLLQGLTTDGVFDAVEYVDVDQSMDNGGGPACLRLRVVLSPQERAAMSAGVVFDESLDARLADWIGRHYREQLAPEDLADPRLLTECHEALDELTGLLGLGALYPFQK